MLMVKMTMTKKMFVIVMIIKGVFNCLTRVIKTDTYGQADREGGGGLSHLGPDRKQM